MGIAMRRRAAHSKTTWKGHLTADGRVANGQRQRPVLVRQAVHRPLWNLTFELDALWSGDRKSSQTRKNECSTVQVEVSLQQIT